VASLGSGHRPAALDKGRERQIRELALEHAAGRRVVEAILAAGSEKAAPIAAVCRTRP
jgi:hypothetical protein